MIAIRLTASNMEKILQKQALDPADLVAMLEEYDTTDRMPIYWTPQWDGQETKYPSWGTLPQNYLDRMYEYDHEKIETEFVEIRLK